MTRTSIRRVLVLGMLAASLSVLPWAPAWAQARKGGAAIQPPGTLTAVPPDPHRTKEELSRLLDRYPPALRGVFSFDPSLLINKSYLEPYPAIAGFLKAHPEIARDPAFYVGNDPRYAPHAPIIIQPPPPPQITNMNMWESVLGGLAALLAFGIAVGLIAWLIRTWIDYRRWSRLATVQTDVHTKLLDRFTANEDLLAYIQSPAGSKFLESTPIALDAGPRSVGAPLGRILWSGQAGVVLVAAGIGLRYVGVQVGTDSSSKPFHALGILGIALGLGLVISAIISFMISHRLGLIERASPPPRAERPGSQFGAETPGRGESAEKR